MLYQRIPLQIFFTTYFSGIFFFFFFLRFFPQVGLFLVAQDFCCCAWAFSSCGQRGLPFTAVHRLLIVVASLVVKHRLYLDAQAIAVAARRL